ncbi:unnamed protein product [Soboliphyme baturini]|uniref:ADP-ribosylglycohydrolase n=1 Tax=Soboliphyme baturini TaxID=241478 RepID=A0A183IZ35_9BILA|nr:unnamed protein product [Soboliphyme baturini]
MKDSDDGQPDALNVVFRTIAFAISFGGDTDTIGTMAGAIAGAFYGDANLPVDSFKRMEGSDYYIEASEVIFKMLTEKNVV